MRAERAIGHGMREAGGDRDEASGHAPDATAAEAWVVDGSYSKVRDIVWGRADTVIWVDPPRHRVMRQLLARTLRRIATGAELWNGNRERWIYLFRPEESILLYAWTNHRKLRARYLSVQDDPENAHLAFVRLRTPADTAALLRDLAGPRASATGKPPARRQA